MLLLHRLEVRFTLATCGQRLVVLGLHGAGMAAELGNQLAQLHAVGQQVLALCLDRC